MARLIVLSTPSHLGPVFASLVYRALVLHAKERPRVSIFYCPPLTPSAIRPSALLIVVLRAATRLSFWVDPFVVSVVLHSLRFGSPFDPGTYIL